MMSWLPSRFHATQAYNTKPFIAIRTHHAKHTPCRPRHGDKRTFTRARLRDSTRIAMKMGLYKNLAMCYHRYNKKADANSFDDRLMHVHVLHECTWPLATTAGSLRLKLMDLTAETYYSVTDNVFLCCDNTRTTGFHGMIGCSSYHYLRNPKLQGSEDTTCCSVLASLLYQPFLYPL
jgi:hypothetical protein